MAFALVIDDDAEIARFVEVVLKEVSFDVEIVSDGKVALEKVVERVPDLVLLDLNIPVVSGVEVLQQIRANSDLANVKVIVISGNPHMADHVYDLADLILQKPMSYDQLLNLVKRFA